jgi:hypothetical protein
MHYELVSFGDEVLLRLTDAESVDYGTATKQIKTWVEDNGYKLFKNAKDTTGSCVIQAIYFADDLPDERGAEAITRRLGLDTLEPETFLCAGCQAQKPFRWPGQ